MISPIPFLHARSHTASLQPPNSLPLFRRKQTFCSLLDHTPSWPRRQRYPQHLSNLIYTSLGTTSMPPILRLRPESPTTLCKVVFHPSDDNALPRIPDVIGIEIQVWHHIFQLHLLHLNWRFLWWAWPCRLDLQRRPFWWGRRSASHSVWQCFVRRTLRRGSSSD